MHLFKTYTRTFGLLAAGTMFLACGSGKKTVTVPGNPGVMMNPPPAGGNKTGVSINASLGLDIADFQVHGEAPIDGMVLIDFNGKEAPMDAMVSINGKALQVLEIVPGTPAPGEYVSNPADPPTVGSDLKLTISASVQGQSASISVDCPADFDVTTSPATSNQSPTPIAAGSSVTASWSPNLWVNSIVVLGLYAPALSIDGYSTGTKTRDFIATSKAMLAMNAQSGMLTVPALESGDDAYLLELLAPGLYKNDNGNVAICNRLKRFVFKKE